MPRGNGTIEDPFNGLPGVRRIGRRQFRHGATSALWKFGGSGDRETEDQRRFRAHLVVEYIRAIALASLYEFHPDRVGEAFGLGGRRVRQIHAQAGTPRGRFGWAYFSAVVIGKAAPLHALPRDGEATKFAADIAAVPWREIDAAHPDSPGNDALCVWNAYRGFHDQYPAWRDHCRLSARTLRPARGKRVNRSAGGRRGHS